jgi:hypothetical protein
MRATQVVSPFSLQSIPVIARFMRATHLLVSFEKEIGSPAFAGDDEFS